VVAAHLQVHPHLQLAVAAVVEGRAVALPQRVVAVAEDKAVGRRRQLVAVADAVRVGLVDKADKADPPRFRQFPVRHPQRQPAAVVALQRL